MTIEHLEPASSLVECWREETFLNVRHIASIPLLQVIWVDQLQHLGRVIISKDHELLVGELINKSVSQFPELANYPGDISGVEAEKPPTIVLCHVINEGLNTILWDLCHSNVLKVEDGCPRLYGSWDHCILDNVLKEEVCQRDQPIYRDS